MRAILLGLLAVSAVAIATPAFAQVTVDTPVGDVRVGPDRGYDRYHHPRYRSYARDCRTHHPPRRRICPSHSALRLSSTDAKEGPGSFYSRSLFGTA